MDQEEAELFLITLAALQQQSADTAETTSMESAEPMTATCEVEYEDGYEPE